MHEVEKGLDLAGLKGKNLLIPVELSLGLGSRGRGAEPYDVAGSGLLMGELSGGAGRKPTCAPLLADRRNLILGDDDGDVVAAASEEGLVEQGLGGVAGLFVSKENFGDRRRHRPCRSGRRCRAKSVAVSQAKPADVAFDLAVMAAQEIGEHVALAMVADLFGGDVAGVGHRLCNGVVLGK